MDSGRATYIYLFKAGAHQKIGRSDNPAKRLAALRSGNPFPMTLAAHWRVRADDAGCIEQTCFNKFRAFSEFDAVGPYRVSEWYRAEAPAMDFLVSMLGPPIPPEPRVWREQFGPEELFLHLDGPFHDDAPSERLAGLNKALERIYDGATYPRSFFMPGPRGDFWFEGYKKELNKRMQRILKRNAFSSFA